MRNEEPSSRGALNGGLTSADSGLQLDLEIALGGVSAKVQPLRLIQPCRRQVETSDDVIEEVFISTPESRILYLSIIRSRLTRGHRLRACLRMRGFGFESTKRRQLFILTHNETFSIVAVRVCNPDRAPVGINS